MRPIRKRLRKKRHIGEFQELGFDLSFRLSEHLGQVALDDFCDQFLANAIEARGLLCGGGGGQRWDLFVTRARSSVSDQDREAVAGWLSESPYVNDVQVGPLIDAWYPA